MIEMDRDAKFWRELANHPDIKPWVSCGFDFDIGELVGNPSVIPLKTDLGGFLFCRLDGLSFVYELHTMFRPEGRGRHVLQAAKLAFERMFGQGAKLIVTYEVQGQPMSRPPKTFRFSPAGEFSETPFGLFRSWFLTQQAWEGSPAFGSR